MKKKVRVTESQVILIVNKVINELKWPGLYSDEQNRQKLEREEKYDELRDKLRKSVFDMINMGYSKDRLFHDVMRFIQEDEGM